MKYYDKRRTSVAFVEELEKNQEGQNFQCVEAKEKSPLSHRQ